MWNSAASTKTALAKIKARKTGKIPFVQRVQKTALIRDQILRVVRQTAVQTPCIQTARMVRISAAHTQKTTKTARAVQI